MNELSSLAPRVTLTREDKRQRLEIALAFLDFFVTLMEIHRVRAVRMKMKPPSIEQVILTAIIGAGTYKGAPLTTVEAARTLLVPRTTAKRWVAYFRDAGMLREDEKGRLFWQTPSIFIGTQPPEALPKMVNAIKVLAGVKPGTPEDENFPHLTPIAFCMVEVGLYLKAREIFLQHGKLINNIEPDFERLMIGYLITTETLQGRTAKKKALARMLSMPRTNVVRKVNSLKKGGIVLEDVEGNLIWQATTSTQTLGRALINAWHGVVLSVLDDLREGRINSVVGIPTS